MCHASLDPKHALRDIDLRFARLSEETPRTAPVRRANPLAALVPSRVLVARLVRLIAPRKQSNV